MTTAIKFVLSAKDQTKGAFKTLTGSLSSAKAGIAALVGVGGFGALIKSSLDSVDALAKTSDRLGITTEALAGLQHAANQTGVSNESLNMGLQRMTRRLGQVAATGKGEAKVALDQLGISIDQLKGRRPEQQFALIAEKLKEVEDQGQKVFITQKLFDSEGVKLLNTLNLGASGLQSMMKDAEQLGLAISRVDAAKIEAANDSLDRVQKQFKGVSNLLTVEVSPFIAAFGDEFVEAANKSVDSQEAIASALKTTSKVVGVLGDGVRGVQVLFQGATVLANGFAAGLLSSINFVINDGLVPFENRFRELILAPIRKMLELSQHMPGIGKHAKAALESINGLGKAEGFKFLKNAAHNSVKNLNESLSEMHNIMMQELPSDVLKRKLENVISRAEEKATQTAENIKKTLSNSSSGGGLLDGLQEVSGATQDMNDSLSFIDWDSFGSRAASALSNVTMGLSSGKELAKGLASSILNEGITSLIQYGMKSVSVYAMEALGFTAAQTTKTAAVTASNTAQAASGMAAIGSVTAASVASGAAITAAMAPAAAATSIATAGAAPAAAAPISLGAIAAIIGALVLGAGAIASFDGGGQTWKGPRTGGLDNKGGRLAILHPNETVLDHTKGQGVASNQNIAVNITMPGDPGADFMDNFARNEKRIVRTLKTALNRPY